MQAMEKDAQERAENRRKNKIIADEWKTKGNDAFHKQLYDEAIEHYTKVKQFEVCLLNIEFFVERV